MLLLLVLKGHQKIRAFSFHVGKLFCFLNYFKGNVPMSVDLFTFRILYLEFCLFLPSNSLNFWFLLLLRNYVTLPYKQEPKLRFSFPLMSFGLAILPTDIFLFSLNCVCRYWELAWTHKIPHHQFCCSLINRDLYLILVRYESHL